MPHVICDMTTSAPDGHPPPQIKARDPPFPRRMPPLSSCVFPNSAVFTTPSVKPGVKFLYFDPISALDDEHQWRWTQPLERQAMMDDALDAAGGRRPRRICDPWPHGWRLACRLQS